MSSQEIDSSSDDHTAYTSNKTCKTWALKEYCLREADLAGLKCDFKPNPHYRSAAPMQLYRTADLLAKAHAKWGGPEGLKAETLKKEERARKRAATKARKKEEAAWLEEERSVPRRHGDSRAGPSAASQPFAPELDEGALLHVFGEGPELPDWLLERVRFVKNDAGTGSVPDQPCVIYWVQTAIRGSENPALDTAQHEATARGLPLVLIAYLPTSSAPPGYATERRYKFMLEGLRDVQTQLEAQGLPVHVFLEGVTQKGSYAARLPALLQNATLIVTEDMPCPPYTAWLKELCNLAPAGAGVWAVDTSCTVPMACHATSYERAYAFKAAVRPMRTNHAKSMLYSDLRPRLASIVPSPTPSWLTWDPLDLSADLVATLRACPGVDLSVLGIEHQVGGSSFGEARWRAWRGNCLSKYAALRNRPLLRNGVSRLSAYHHFGMVSPFKIAREAAASAGAGKTKFLQEFLDWRELCYTVCSHADPCALNTLDVLPEWARATLTLTAGDVREVKTVAQLENGETGDPVWDAMQRQFRDTGELHNNLRMTWGKALLCWTATPERSLELTLAINNKYGLDGWDPCSYGGVLWCHGLFDGPRGSDKTAVFGRLRKKPTAAMAKKCNPDALAALPANDFLLLPQELPTATAEKKSGAAKTGGRRGCKRKAATRVVEDTLYSEEEDTLNTEEDDYAPGNAYAWLYHQS